MATWVPSFFCRRCHHVIARDDNGRPAKIYRRPVGGAAKDDVLVYDEPDEGFFIGAGVTQSRKWIVIGCGNQDSSEAWLIPASNPTAAPMLPDTLPASESISAAWRG